MSSAFIDISSTSSGGKKSLFACQPHQAVFCNICSMDFGLLNSRCRNDSLPTKSAIDKYFKKTKNIVPPGAVPNPKAMVSINEMLTDKSTDINTLIEVFSYLTHVSYHQVFARQRLVSLLDKITESLVKESQFWEEESKNLKNEQKDRKQKAKQMRKDRNDNSAIGERTDKIHHMMLSSIEDIAQICARNHIEIQGSFMNDLMNAMEAVSKIGEDMNDINASAKAAVHGASNSSDKTIEIPDDVRKGLENLAKWESFILKSTKGCVISMKDPKDWSTGEIKKLLQKHDIEFHPYPSRLILNQVVKHLVKFEMACASYINAQPDEDQFAALGSLSLGSGTEKDQEIVNKLYAPAKYADFIAEPQIEKDFTLKNLQRLHISDPEKIFSRYRVMHRKQFYQETFHKVLELIDNVVESWDRIHKGLEKDIIQQLEANEGCPDTIKNLALRPLALWTLKDESSEVIPLLGVEYFYASQRTAGPDDVMKFTQGLRKETVYQTSKISEESMDLFSSLLDRNRDNLDKNDEVVKKFKKSTPRGWRFSVLRPVDPLKRGGCRICPVCNKDATKTCSRCKAVAYCGRGCQVEHWKSHKKICNKL